MKKKIINFLKEMIMNENLTKDDILDFFDENKLIYDSNLFCDKQMLFNIILTNLLMEMNEDLQCEDCQNFERY